ncbi:MAG: hypothetical protein WB677_06985 [Xanthobacteraceae bacterium]
MMKNDVDLTYIVGTLPCKKARGFEELSQHQKTGGGGDENSRRERSASIVGGVGIPAAALVAGPNSRLIE